MPNGNFFHRQWQEFSEGNPEKIVTLATCVRSRTNQLLSHYVVGKICHTHGKTLLGYGENK
jgi:hypothetical protein